MFWGIFGILILCLMAYWVLALRDHEAGSDARFGYGVLIVISSLAWLIPAIIITGNVWKDGVKAENSAVLVKAKTEQRDVLLAGVKDALSAESYAALMAATPDADVLVLLGNQVSPIMLERAKQIVDLNNTLFSLQNRITQLRMNVCNANDNPFLPHIPFALPDCKL